MCDCEVLYFSFHFHFSKSLRTLRAKKKKYLKMQFSPLVLSNLHQVCTSNRSSDRNLDSFESFKLEKAWLVKIVLHKFARLVLLCGLHRILKVETLKLIGQFAVAACTVSLSL